MDFNNEKAIYLQIVEQIKMEIISGKKKANEKLKSIRDLAIEYKVNPNTMQRSLLELERLNLIYTERTSGKYVTDDKNIISKIKNEYINLKLNEFINNMHDIGIDKEEIIKKIKEMKGDQL